MGLFQNIIGIMGDVFQLGGPTGGKLKNSAGIIMFRNAADSAYTTIQALGARFTNGAGANKVWVSNASGDGSWQDLSAISGEGSLQDAFTQATSSPIAMGTIPANAVITRTWVSPSVAAGGGSPSIVIGVAATPALYMAATESSLLAVNDYVKDQVTPVGASPVSVIATIVVSGQTFTGTVGIEWETPG